MATQEELWADVVAVFESFCHIFSKAKSSSSNRSNVFKNLLDLVNKLYDSINTFRNYFLNEYDSYCRVSQANEYSSSPIMTNDDQDTNDEDGKVNISAVPEINAKFTLNKTSDIRNNITKFDDAELSTLSQTQRLKISSKGNNFGVIASNGIFKETQKEVFQTQSSFEDSNINTETSMSKSNQVKRELIVKLERLILSKYCNISEETEQKQLEVNNSFEPVDYQKDENKVEPNKKQIETDDSDYDEGFSTFHKKKSMSKKELFRKVYRRMKRPLVMSDSDSEFENSDADESEKENNTKKFKMEQNQVPLSDLESPGAVTNNNSGPEKSKQGEQKTIMSEAKLNWLQCAKYSSSFDNMSTRKNIRKVIGRDSLSESTKKAEAEEKERKARLLEKQKKHNHIFPLNSEGNIEKIVLEYNEDSKAEELVVCPSLVRKLKPHQASGVQFMWDACFESLRRAKNTSGSGCILAHCMGLGKTLQAITFIHTLLVNSEKTKVSKVIVVCPVNTVLNWKREFKKWVKDEDDVDDIDVYELVSCKENNKRLQTIKEWHKNGGVLIIGYAMFRILSNPDNMRLSKQMRTSFLECLVDPGPDLVVCDEGHLLKNEKTNLSIAMNRIKTLRRIVLTGTPLQNNLKEYWCMVQFIKPNLLGTYKEYLNRFVNPITNGQYTDSTPLDIHIMRKRSHVLHKLLDGVVQRRDYGVLEPYLPTKFEYVLFVPLTEKQVKLYQHYMDHFARRSDDGSNRTAYLFTDFHELQRICTHPRVLLDKSVENYKKGLLLDSDEDEEGLENDLNDDISLNYAAGPSVSNSNSFKSGGEKECNGYRAKAHTVKGEQNDQMEKSVHIANEWWQEYCDGFELEKISNSGKVLLLFEILKKCEEIGDKVLIFSQSLYTLNSIEHFLRIISEATENGEDVYGFTGSWVKGLDYFRLDGSSNCDDRIKWCDIFNNPRNKRARLFLISTKAGGLGINLVAANRVIIFDVSWNPSHDVQSLYRVYRFGQTKPCYIYRLVSYGTMEMTIYERQVTKQSISKRVIDEQQIDRHYSQSDIQELYKTDLMPQYRPIPLVPEDLLLGEMLQKFEKYIFKYHDHQSLLENIQEEELNEEERKAAWDEFENEKILRDRSNSVFNFGGSEEPAQADNLSPVTISFALANIIRKDNPTWSETEIRSKIPALIMQMRGQIANGDLSMFKRMQNEIRLNEIEDEMF